MRTRAAKEKAAAAESKQRRWRLKHLITLVVAIAVVCGASYSIVLYHSYKAGKPPVEAANTFLDALETKSNASAYLMLCPATKRQFSQDKFNTYVKDQPAFDDHSSTAVSLSTVDGVDSAIVTEKIKNSSGSSSSRSIVLSKEGGKWLVCGQPY